MVKRIAVIIGLLFLASPFTAAAGDGKALRGVALVIGQSGYEHLAPLTNPENDADAIEALLGDLGFDSVRRTDRDASALARDLERFAEDAEDADVAVLYYSGHGIEAGGENFLVPVDADLSALDDAGAKLVPISALIEKLKATVPVAIVMLDACRDNPFPAGSELRLSSGSAPVPVAASGLGETRSAASLKATGQTSQPEPDAENVGTVIAFAAEPGMVALDGDAGGNSPYAGAVLRHFDAMAGEEFGMVMRMVAEEVYLKTGGRQRPWMNESLRRQLFFGDTPDPVEGEAGDILRERRQLLVTIAALPDRERKSIETVASDTGVPMDALYGMLKALGSEAPEDPAKLETLLRDQTDKVKAMIAERDTLKSSDPEIMRLSALADQALAEGALTTAIALRQQAKARAQQVETTVQDAEAELRQRRIELAEVYAKSAEAYALAFKHREAAHDYEEASRQLERWDDEQAFWYLRSASTAYLEAGKLRGGIADFERSAQTGERAARMAERLLADRPEELQHWQDSLAQTLNNWANANNALYSATRRPEALNHSIDAYERALEVLSRDRVEGDWALVQHNLAGSLMMLGEQETGNATISRAIDTYKAALEVWTREANPTMWAHAIANMGNAQTVLGERMQSEAVLREAIASLSAALEVQSQDDPSFDWAWTQRELGDAWGALAQVTHDESDARRSVAARQEALKVYTLDVAPRSWAQTLHDMATDELSTALPEKRLETRRRTIAIYEQILSGIDPDELPVEYALSSGNLGSSLVDLGRADKAADTIEAGIARLRTAVGIYKKLARMPDAAAYMQDTGAGLLALGRLRSSPLEVQEAVDVYNQAIEVYRQNGDDAKADGIRSTDVASALVELGYQRSKAADYKGAVAAYQASLDSRDRETDPENWLFSARELAIALHNLGAVEDGSDTLRKAADSYRLALSATPDDDPQARLNIQNGLIGVLNTISERARDAVDYVALADAYGASAALKERTSARDGRDSEGRDLDVANRAWALAYAGELGNDARLLEQAADIYGSLPDKTGMTAGDRVFHLLNRARTLFLLANAGGGNDARRQAIAVIDDNWPLIEKEGSGDQKVNALLDRASLLQAAAFDDPKAFTPEQIEQAFAQAATVARGTDDPMLLQAAQRALAAFKLAGVEDPAYSTEQMRAGLAALRELLAVTPQQTAPSAWAEAANWYGYTLSLQGRREGNAASFEEALPLLRGSLAAYEAAGDELSVAHVRDSLCGALVGLGRLTGQRALVTEGAENCDKAVAFMRAQKLAEVLPVAEANLADARKALDEMGKAAP